MAEIDLVVEKEKTGNDAQLAKSLLRAKLFNRIALENYKKEERERKKREEELNFIPKQKEAFNVIKRAIEK